MDEMSDAEYLARLSGLRPSSGRRPEELNVSGNVNMPLQGLRGWAATTAGLPGDIETFLRFLYNQRAKARNQPASSMVDETSFLPTSDFYKEWLPGRDTRPAGKFAEEAGGLFGGVGATKVARGLEKGANVAVPAAARPFTPVPFTVEAVSPELGQIGSRPFKEGLTRELIGPRGALDMSTLGGKPTSQVSGQGVYRNKAGVLETNPMEVFYVPGVRDISKSPELIQNLASTGAALEQEAMAGIRFLPMATNKAEDASAMLIKTKKGSLTPEQIVKLSEALGSSMVVSHNPRLGGVVVVPFGEVKRGSIPTEFVSAQTAAKDILGKDAKINYGVADINKDRFFMEKSDYPLWTGPRPASPEFEKYRDELKYMEKRMFGSGPEGGVQSWSRSPAYPTSVIGRGENWQPVNYATEQYGSQFPTFREANEARQKMLEDWQRSMPGKIR